MSSISDWGTQFVELQVGVSVIASAWGVASAELTASLDRATSSWGTAHVTLAIAHQPVLVWNGSEFQHSYLMTWDGVWIR